MVERRWWRSSEDLVDIAALRRIKGVEPEIVEDEQIDRDEAAHLALDAVVEPRGAQLFEHVLGAHEKDAVAAAASDMSQARSEVSLADADRTEDQDVVVVSRKRSVASSASSWRSKRDLGACRPRPRGGARIQARLLRPQARRRAGCAARIPRRGPAPGSPGTGMARSRASRKRSGRVSVIGESLSRRSAARSSRRELTHDRLPGPAGTRSASRRKRSCPRSGLSRSAGVPAGALLDGLLQHPSHARDVDDIGLERSGAGLLDAPAPRSGAPSRAGDRRDACVAHGWGPPADARRRHRSRRRQSRPAPSESLLIAAGQLAHAQVGSPPHRCCARPGRHARGS